MGTTNPDNIYFVEPTPAFPVDVPAESAAQASSIQNALNGRQFKSYKWANQTARAAQTGMTAGDEGYQVDTGVTYRYNGSIWRNTAQAMYLMIPTASSGSISQNGVVSFSGATSVNIDGCFTSEFANYLVSIDIPTTSASLGVLMQMRTAGVTNTLAVYDSQKLYALGSSVTPVAQNNLALTSWAVGAATSSIHAGEFRVYRPFIATATFGMADMVATTNPMTAAATVAVQQISMLHRNATSFDGLNISSSTAGTMTGTIRVYGYTGV